MIRRHLEQKTEGSQFKDWNKLDQRPILGAPTNRKAKGEGASEVKTRIVIGECTQWTPKGKCERRDPTSFEHGHDKRH